MGKYLKKFETTAQYNAYTADTANFIKPNVSLITENNTVEYNPLVIPPTPSHDYVEIGGIKWATMNIGASSVIDAGLYFQWGDIQGYTASQVGTDKVFNWANYKYSDNGTTAMTKYNSTDGKTVLEAVDDAAVANWGGSWRMPTADEFVALGNAVNTAWTSDYNSSGIAGMICTAKDGSGAQLFFPAAGRCGNSAVGNVGSNGYYWSSWRNLNDDEANLLKFGDGEVNWDFYTLRYLGYSIRPVVD